LPLEILHPSALLLLLCFTRDVREEEEKEKCCYFIIMYKIIEFVNNVFVDEMHLGCTSDVFKFSPSKDFST